MQSAIVNPVSVSTVNSVSLLHSRAVLFKFSAGQATGRKKDKKMTNETKRAHGMTEDLAAVWKSTLPGKELADITAAIQRARNLWEKLTAPWIDGGLRIAPSARAVEIKREIDEAIRDVYAKVDALILAYPEVIERAKAKLNGAFDYADYPSADTLRAKFYVSLQIHPVPSIADFRVDGISDAVCEQLREEMENATAQRIIDAKRDLLARVSDKVSHLSEKLAGLTEKSRFHASTVTNIKEACEEVRAANFDGDTAIDALTQRVETLIADLNPDSISDDLNAQAKAQETARLAMAEIESAMAGFVC